MEKSFEENFEKVYDVITFDTKNSLKKIKKKFSSLVFLVFLIMCITDLIMYLNNVADYNIVGVIAIEILLLIVLIDNVRKIYSKKYKSLIILALVKGYDENLNYSVKSLLNSMAYKTSNFDRSFDTFYSEDNITGKMNQCSLQLAEIVTYIKTEYNENGNIKSYETETYRGIYGVVNLNKSFVADISILNDSHSKKYSKDRVEVDSEEFEKNYDLLTKDKVLALRIFTSDIIEMFNEILAISKNKYPFELKIRDNMIYFRYKCGKLFEKPLFKNEFDKDVIKNYYKYIYYPLEIINSVSKSVKNVIETDK